QDQQNGGEDESTLATRGGRHLGLRVSELKCVRCGTRSPSVSIRSTEGRGSRFPVLSSVCEWWGLLRLLDGELAEREPDVHPASGSVQGERNLSLGQGLCVGRLAGPRVRLRLDVRSEQLVETPGPGDSSRAAADLALPEG